MLLQTHLGMKFMNISRVIVTQVVYILLVLVQFGFKQKFAKCESQLFPPLIFFKGRAGDGHSLQT